MSSKAKPKATPPTVSDDYALAMLAVQFLPKIDLSAVEKDDLKYSETFARSLEVLRTGRPKDNYEKDGTWNTTRSHFEVMAEEAVARARVLLMAVRGQRRVNVTDDDEVLRQNDEYEAQLAQQHEQICREHFDKHTKGKRTVSMSEALRCIFPRHQEANREAILRACFRERVESHRRAEGLPALHVTFTDTATDEEFSRAVQDADKDSPLGPPNCIVLRDPMESPVARKDFGTAFLELKAFEAKNWERIRKDLNLQGGRPRGKGMSVRDKALLKSSELSARDKALLDAAAAKHSSSERRKPRPSAKKVQERRKNS